MQTGEHFLFCSHNQYAPYRSSISLVFSNGSRFVKVIITFAPSLYKLIFTPQYKPYTLIVNVGQALELLTGGLFPATIHRVVTPPTDQVNFLRVGIYYFSRPNDDYILNPMKDSPILKRLGKDRPLDPTVTYNTAQFLEAKKHGYLKPELDFDRPRDSKMHSDPFHDGDTIKPTEKPLASIHRSLVA